MVGEHGDWNHNEPNTQGDETQHSAFHAITPELEGLSILSSPVSTAQTHRMPSGLLHNLALRIELIVSEDAFQFEFTGSASDRRQMHQPKVTNFGAIFAPPSLAL
jgi:hypothetical protein